MVTKCCKW